MAFINNINPVLFSLGSLEIRFYGLVYVLGAIVGLLVLLYYQKKGKIDLTKDEVWDFVFWLMVGLVVGARLFAVVFFSPGFYFTNPLEIFKVWKGGMSFHGGVVGLIVVGYIYARKKKLDFWKLADMIAIPGIIVAGLGRLANFTNSEFYGTATNLPWCVVFKKIDDVCRHPYQIYSFFQRVVLGGALAWIYRKDRKPGFIFWLMILFEGIGRILVDTVRVESKFLYLSMGQWLSVVMAVVAIVVLIKWYRKELKNLISFR
ncbi:prolipoprotein diacylglyceryl transferase [Nanoarchaeota archaeon]